MKNLLLRILARIDRQTASEWRGLIEARGNTALDKKLEFAFSVTDKHGNERRFFMFKNPVDRPPRRSLTYTQRMAELAMGLDRETLKEWTAAMRGVLSPENGHIHLGKIWELVIAMDQRLAMAPMEEHLYVAASVEFFELTEDLTDYDLEVNAAKIALWKQSGPSHAFFLTSQVADRLPLIEQLGTDLESLFKMQQLELRSQAHTLNWLPSE